MKKVERGRGKEEAVRTTVYLRKEQYEWVKEKRVNLSRFVQEKLEEEMYIPLFVVRFAGAEFKPMPEGSIILLPKEKEGEIVEGKRGKYLLHDGIKYYVEIVGWNAVRKRRYVYVWD